MIMPGIIYLSHPPSDPSNLKFGMISVKRCYFFELKNRTILFFHRFGHLFFLKSEKKKGKNDMIMTQENFNMFTNYYECKLLDRSCHCAGQCILTKPSMCYACSNSSLSFSRNLSWTRVVTVLL